MIKVLITVGTTPFDELIKFCDETIDLKQYDVLAQVSNNSTYKVKNIKSIKFSENIFKLYNDADIIISHAGAGSVYNLLEMRKKTIFVPNFTMKDNHQNDICQFVKKNNFAEIFDLRKKGNINLSLSYTYNNTFNAYKKDHSELIGLIYKVINS